MTAPNTFTSCRTLAANPDQVLNAFRDPEVLASWWGPEGFSNTIHAFDFKPGGIWKLDMRGPDGSLYPNEYRFQEISPERILIHHPGPVHEFQLEVLIKGNNGESEVTWNQTFKDAGEYERCGAFVPTCNEQNLDRLAIQLAIHFPRELNLVFHRIIDAPAARLFKGWTDPALIVQWFTPPPYKTISADLDVRPGGRSLIMMQAPDGTEFPNPGVYLEVVENKRLVFTDAYTEAWKPSPKPFVTIELTFEDLGGKTRYTAIARHWTLADREAHEAMNFQQGWGIATDQLVELVSGE